VIEHRFAPHLGRVRGQHRHDERIAERGRHRVLPDPLLAQRLDHMRHVGAALRAHTLSVLGEVREHRKQHESARERQRLVEAQRIEPAVDIARHAAMTIDRGRTDIFDPPIQRLAPQFADDVAQDAPKKADIGILRDGFRGHDTMLHCGIVSVNLWGQLPLNSACFTMPP